jgi:serine protease Do
MENNTERLNTENKEPENLDITNGEKMESEKYDISNKINEYSNNVVHGENFVILNSTEPVNNVSAEENTTIANSNPSDNSVTTNSAPAENTYNNMSNSTLTNYDNVKRDNTTPSFNNYSNEKPRKKKGMFKKVMSYVLVGAVCTTIGGAASGAAILYGLPNTSLFKTSPLYKAITNNGSTATKTVYDNHPTQLSATSNALSASEIAKKVGPAVVAVTTTVQGQQDFLGRQSVQQGVGSGMIISKDGYILTNYHVVEGAKQIKVVLSNNTQANAKLVNYDANYDVAIVQITDKIEMPAVVELGESSSLQVGEEVVAIGNPLGTDFFGSVTNGIVSALNRKIQGDTNKATYIQTNAAINSGNSGGPLINSRGQVVGINTAKIKESGVEGLGFAIPIDAIKDKIPSLSKPIILIGIQGRDIDDALAKQYNMPLGAYVGQVQQFSPAEKAGIVAGDVIVKFDGKSVKTYDEISAIKEKHKSGDEIAVTVNRDGKEVNLKLKLAEQK